MVLSNPSCCSGGTQIITFLIVSSDPTSREAIVELNERSFRGKTYGSFLGDTVVYVYDTEGCHLNEPNVDLTGRRGKAVLMYVNAEVAALHFGGLEYAPEKYWQVLSICCPTTVCEELGE